MEAQGPHGTPPQQPAGWYPNPAGPGTRYWDGTQWTDNFAPPAEKPKKQRTFLKVLLAILVAGLLLIGGCVALIGGAADQAGKELDKDQKQHAITKAQYDSLKTNAATKADVVGRYGAPDSSDEFEAKDVGGSDCIYYNDKGGEVGDFFQLCFDKAGGNLESKSAY